MRITDEARDHIINYLDGAGVIRLRVVRMGCAGVSFVVGLADSHNDNDEAFECNGVSIVMAREDMYYTHDLTIGFEDDGLQSRFTFVSADLDAKCGCGASFQYRANNGE